jgi:2-polyprenyl-3-methyl-5-hydroxy-6-metoxy-1,4-benzoquinol methylase
MLISESYRGEQTALHNNHNYGVASVEFAPIVTKIINQMQIAEMLDYGAGKGRLAQSIEPDHDISITHYDPAIPAWAETPDSHQFVTCIDVLEHIEPDLIDNVLDDLVRVTEIMGFFSIHTGPAVKVLSDGRNAHLIQEPSSWWLPKIMSRFELLSFTRTKNGFYVTVGSKWQSRPTQN